MHKHFKIICEAYHSPTQANKALMDDYKLNVTTKLL